MARLIGAPPRGSRARRACAGTRCAASRRAAGPFGKSFAPFDEVADRLDRGRRLDQLPGRLLEDRERRDGAARRVQVRELLRLARHVGPVRLRHAAAVRRRAGTHAVAGRGRAGVEVLVVAVREAALAGQARHAALELVADLLAGVLGLVAGLRVRDLEVHERHEHVVRAGRERARLAQERTDVLLNATTSGIVWRSTRAVPRSSSSDISRRRLLDERERRGERLVGRAHAGQRVVSEGAQRRQRVVQRAERGLADPERVAQSRDRRGERLVLAGESARGDVEVRHQVLERRLVLDQRREASSAAPSGGAGRRGSGPGRATRRWRASRSGRPAPSNGSPG